MCLRVCLCLIACVASENQALAFNNCVTRMARHIGSQGLAPVVRIACTGFVCILKTLEFWECIFKALKIIENLCSSFLVLESPWIFFWPAFLIFENFSENKQPLKSCHTNATSCGVENGYQCLCIIFMHVRYWKWGRIVLSHHFYG